MTVSPTAAAAVLLRPFFVGIEHAGRGGGAQLQHLAVDETVILLHPPLPLVDVSIAMERERQQNDSLVNG